MIINLKIVRVNSDYCDYLRKFDNKVAYNKNEKELRPFIGINENYIEGIFIDTNNQCKGIGTSLLNKVKENRDNLTLSVYKKNINAINFYKKNDFIITSENIDKDTAEIEYTMTWNK